MKNIWRTYLFGASKEANLYIYPRVCLEKTTGLEREDSISASRDVLIKSMIQAIPTYSMSCFKLPEGLIKDIEVMICKFWWGYSGDSRKIHWVKWDRLCDSKKDGGMDFKEIEKFNEALLAKQVLCMMNNPDSLCYKVFKAIFFFPKLFNSRGK